MEGRSFLERWRALQRWWVVLGDRTRALIWALLMFALSGIAIPIILALLGWIDLGQPAWELTLNLFLGVLTAIAVGFILNSQISQDLEKKFQIIQHAEHARLVGIYEDRPTALKKFCEYADSKRMEQIDILTIAGKNFFHSGSEPYKTLFERPLARGAPHRFRILLLHPASNAAVERSHRELPRDDRLRLDTFIAANHATATAAEIDRVAPYRRRSNCRDVIHSLGDLANVSANYAYKGFGKAPRASSTDIPQLQARLHYSTPSLQLIRIDDRVFVEQYHLGKDEQHASETMDNCLARKVPIFEYLTLGAPGKLLVAHFDYLWQRSEAVIGHDQPDLDDLEQRFADPDQYVGTLAALHIYGDKLNRFLRAPPPRKL